jgi:hypothetical protein
MQLKDQAAIVTGLPQEAQDSLAVAIAFPRRLDASLHIAPR